jgi:transcriptional regulator with XRE-family HTH domain
MIHLRLKYLRKQKGLKQEDMAKILSTDVSSYSRKENGKSKIYDAEWDKLARILKVPVDEIKDSEDSAGIHLSNSIIENLQDYIAFLKYENEDLKTELEKLKNK